MSFLSLIRAFSKILIATFSFVRICSANLTFPKVPLPSDFPEQKQIKLVSSNLNFSYRPLTEDVVPKSDALFMRVLLAIAYLVRFFGSLSMCTGHRKILVVWLLLLLGGSYTWSLCRHLRFVRFYLTNDIGPLFHVHIAPPKAATMNNSITGWLRYRSISDGFLSLRLQSLALTL